MTDFYHGPLRSRSSSTSTLTSTLFERRSGEANRDLGDFVFNQFEPDSPSLYSSDSLAWNLNPPTLKLSPAGPVAPPTLDEILANSAHHPYSLTGFVSYMFRQRCIETLEFILDVAKYSELYKQRTSEGRPKSLVAFYERIVNTYFGSRSEKELNLPEDIKRNLRKSLRLVGSLNSCTLKDTDNLLQVYIHPKVFDEVTKLTKALIRENAYLGFVAYAKSTPSAPTLQTVSTIAVPYSTVRSKSLPDASLLTSSLDGPQIPSPLPVPLKYSSSSCLPSHNMPVPSPPQPSPPGMDYYAISPFADVITPPNSPFHNLEILHRQNQTEQNHNNHPFRIDQSYPCLNGSEGIDIPSSQNRSILPTINIPESNSLPMALSADSFADTPSSKMLSSSSESHWRRMTRKMKWKR
ncbi:hypothetical protein NADFUDRAFT_48189 [Nadsonia fulvescens var. elongata DSM 6958]|uniref:RGS domain-containing protein n=1 Tax=Nadsonia fulvescens var. elongata DSM 6958 TaxID=857566 RepID=A0A1E3PDL1_9ASCO|nr:hypothetical protein NADFUDRAFT_48189 [Nadsonia fulvescens var. elongata DSM 6958]